ncbi:MAG: hypothetical protein P4N24_22370 [Acidobacteriota bacterium]|nr:hypothetical protein [Acidobacteriota bacterium]
MRNYLIVMAATICLGFTLAGTVRAQNVDWRAQQQLLKVQQKRERDALKIQQRNIKQSWKNARVSSAMRDESNHQMQRASRDLKQRQKDARQDLKDRQKALQENRRNYGQ